MSDSPAGSSSPEVACRASDGFADWLSQAGGSVLISTYQAGVITMIGWDGCQVSALMRRFDKPMGMALQADQLAVVTRQGVVLLANSPHQARTYPPDKPAGYDALFLPRAVYRTCDLLIHDVAFGSGDELWVVNTRFSCLATLSRRFSFQPQWQPPFIDQLAPEDRCHLNGLAMDSGKPKYVTALGETNDEKGWRPNKATGGVVIDVASGETFLRGLCMPHSPRWHDGMLWYLNSGQGQLCVVQPGQSKPTVVCTLPGYLRGLSFVGMHALIGMGLIREKHTFGGLPIGEDNTNLHCGVAVVDLTTGEMTGMLKFTSGCEEIYEVGFVPGVRRGMILNTKDPVSQQAITAPEFAYWMRKRKGIDGQVD